MPTGKSAPTDPAGTASRPAEPQTLPRAHVQVSRGVDHHGESRQAVLTAEPVDDGETISIRKPDVQHQQIRLDDPAERGGLLS
jgi:hypothetical protein